MQRINVHPILYFLFFDYKPLSKYLKKRVRYHLFILMLHSLGNHPIYSRIHPFSAKLFNVNEYSIPPLAQVTIGSSLPWPPKTPSVKKQNQRPPRPKISLSEPPLSTILGTGKVLSSATLDEVVTPSLSPTKLTTSINFSVLILGWTYAWLTHPNLQCRKALKNRVGV